jgi:hypothetical protein
MPTPTPTPTPTATPIYVLKNECAPFTLFDLGISCNVIQQPLGTNDGILSLKITGGTSPYTIYWNGVLGQQTIGNLGPGSYSARVVDYYGDYTANTICSLIAPSPTPTPSATSTPTPTPTPVWSRLCLIAIGETSYGPVQFTALGTVNGKPYWGSGEPYNIVWKNNRWEIVGPDLTTPVNFNGGGIFVSNTTSTPPTSGWVVNGGTKSYSITMLEGTCPISIPLQTTVTKVDAICDGTSNCDGSIIVNAQYGTAPYQYSINNGVSWQSGSIFQGLCPNTYTVLTRDTTMNVISNTVVIGYQQSPQTYQVQVTLMPELTQQTDFPNYNEKIVYAKIETVPQLPLGVTLQTTLNLSKVKIVNGPGSGDTFDSILLTKNNVPVSEISSSSVTQIGTRPNCNPEDQTVTTENSTYLLTIQGGDEVILRTTSTLVITTGQIGLQSNCTTELEQVISTSISQSTLTGCNCCSISVDENIITVNNNVVSYTTDSIIF